MNIKYSLWYSNTWDTRRIKKCWTQSSWRFSVQNSTKLWWNFRCFRLEICSQKRTGFSLNTGIYEVIDLNNTLKYILPDNVRVSVTLDDVTSKSNSKIFESLKFTDKSFFYTPLGFTHSHQGPLNDIEGFYRRLPGSYKGERPINITGIDEVHLKCDC